MPEMILEYLRKEADKEVARKIKAKKQDMDGFISDSMYRWQRRSGRYIGCKAR